MIVVVAEQIPVAVEDKTATVAQPASDDLQTAAVGMHPQDRPAGVGNPVLRGVKNVQCPQ